MLPHTKRICILYLDAGGGHRATALALEQLLCQYSNYELKLYNIIDECLFPLDLPYRLFKIKGETIYNKWVVGSRISLIYQQMGYIGVRYNMRVMRHKAMQLLQSFWQRVQPDAVISVLPFFNHDLIASLHNHAAHVPYITLMTDMTECFSEFWHSRLDHYFICNEAMTYTQFLQQGHAKETLFLISNLLLRPSLYEAAQTLTQAQARSYLGLDPQLPTAMVSYGGMGSPIMYKIAQQLCRLPQSAFQVIFICGHHANLRTQLERLATPYTKQVVGFTPDLHYYLAAADFFIGKPGPGSMHEALLFGKPLLLHCNLMTQSHEKANARWAQQQGYAHSFGSPCQLRKKVQIFLDKETLATMQQRVATYENKAPQEIIKILSSIRV